MTVNRSGHSNPTSQVVPTTTGQTRPNQPDQINPPTQTEPDSDQNQTTQARVANFDPVATQALSRTQSSSSQPSSLPPVAEVNQKIADYQAIIERHKDKSPSQLTPEDLNEIDRTERDMAILLTSYSRYVAANPSATTELEQLTLWMKEIKPTRQLSNRIRKHGNITNLMNMPDSRAGKKRYASLTVGLPAIEAGMQTPNRSRKPRGMNGRYYNIGRALAKQGVSQDDLYFYIQHGKETTAIKAVIDKADNTGSWTAINSVQGLIEMRVAALRVQGEELQNQINELARQKSEAPAHIQPQLEAQIRQKGQQLAEHNRQIDSFKAIRKRAINNGSQRRINRGNRQLSRAQKLEERAAKLEPGSAKAQRLRQRATRIRSSGTKRLASEGRALEAKIKTREARNVRVPSRLRNQATQAYHGAASGGLQIASVQVAKVKPGEVPDMPEVLQNGQGVDAYLDAAERVHQDGDDQRANETFRLDQESLRSQRLGLRRQVHQQRYSNGGYQEAVSRGEAPDYQAMQARRDYLTEGQELLASLDKRIDILSQRKSLTSDQHQELAQIRHTAGTIQGEAAQVIASDNRAQVEFNARSDQLEALTGERRQIDEQIEAAAKNVESQKKVRDGLDPDDGRQYTVAQEQLDARRAELANLKARKRVLDGESGKPSPIAQARRQKESAEARLNQQRSESATLVQSSGDNTTASHFITSADTYYANAEISYIDALTSTKPKNTEKQTVLMEEYASFQLNQAEYHAQAQDALTSEYQLEPPQSRRQQTASYQQARQARATKAFDAIQIGRDARQSLPTDLPGEGDRARHRGLQVQQVLSNSAVAQTFAPENADGSLELLEEGQTIVQTQILPGAQNNPERQQADYLSSGLASAGTRVMGELYQDLGNAVRKGRYNGTHIDRALDLVVSVTDQIQDPAIAAPHRETIANVTEQFGASREMAETANQQIINGHQLLDAEMDATYYIIRDTNDGAISDIIDLGSEIVFWGDSMEDQMNAAARDRLGDHMVEDGQRQRQFSRAMGIFQQGLANASPSRRFEYLGLVLANQPGNHANADQINQQLNREFLQGVTIPNTGSLTVRFGNQEQEIMSYNQIDGSDNYTPAEHLSGKPVKFFVPFDYHPTMKAFKYGETFQPQAYQRSMGSSSDRVISEDGRQDLNYEMKDAAEWAEENRWRAIANAGLETLLFVVVPIPLGSVRSGANAVRAWRGFQGLRAVARVPGVTRALNGASQLSRAIGSSRAVTGIGNGLNALKNGRPVLYAFGRGATQMAVMQGVTMGAEHLAKEAWGVESKAFKAVRLVGQGLDIGFANRISNLKQLVPQVIMAEGMLAFNMFALPRMVDDPQTAQALGMLIGALVPAGIGAYGIRGQARGQAAELSSRVYPDTNNPQQNQKRQELEFDLEREMGSFALDNQQQPANTRQFEQHSTRLNQILSDHGVPPQQRNTIIQFQRTQWAYQKAAHTNQAEFTHRRPPQEADAKQLVDSTAQNLIETGVPPLEAYTQAGQYIAQTFSSQAKHLRTDGSMKDQYLAGAYDSVEKAAGDYAQAAQWTHSLDNIPDSIRPQVQESLGEQMSQYRQQVQEGSLNPQTYLQNFHQQLNTLEINGNKLGEAEINTLLTMETQRITQEGIGRRLADFESRGIELDEVGLRNLVRAEAEQLGLPRDQATRMADILMNRAVDGTTTTAADTATPAATTPDPIIPDASRPTPDATNVRRNVVDLSGAPRIDGQVRPLTASTAQQIVSHSQAPTRNRLAEALVDSVTPEFIQQHHLEPVVSIPMGEADIHLSRPYELAGGREAVMAYVEIDGKTHLRAFYRSKSQGIWRVASHAGDGTNNYWIGKGDGEHTTNLPITMQRVLNDHLQNQRGLSMTSSQSQRAFYGVLDQVSDREFAREGASSGPSLGRFTQHLNGPYRSRRGDPRSFEFNDPQQAPNFEASPERFSLDLPEYGQVEAYVFPSQDGNLNYMFLRDNQGKAWVAQVEMVDSTSGAFGSGTRTIDPGDLDMPGREYAQQIPYKYGGSKSTDYKSAFDYIKDLPFMQDFYHSQGLPIPGNKLRDAAGQEWDVIAITPDRDVYLHREGSEQQVIPSYRLESEGFITPYRAVKPALPEGFQRYGFIRDGNGESWQITDVSKDGQVLMWKPGSDPDGGDIQFVDIRQLAENYSTRPDSDNGRLPEGYYRNGYVEDLNGDVWQITQATEDGQVVMWRPSDEPTANDFKMIPAHELNSANYKTPQHDIQHHNRWSNGEYEVSPQLAAELGIIMDGSQAYKIYIMNTNEDGSFHISFFNDQLQTQAATIPPGRLNDIFPPPSRDAFQERFPVANQPGELQAHIQLDPNNPRDFWEVRDFNEETGLVTLEQHQMDYITPDELARKFEHINPMTLQEGAIIMDAQGKGWRVEQAMGVSGNRNFVISRRNTTRVPASEVMKKTPVIHTETQIPTINGRNYLDTLGQEIRQMYDYFSTQRGRSIELVGRSNMSQPQLMDSRPYQFHFAENTPELPANIYQITINQNGTAHPIEIVIPTKSNGKPDKKALSTILKAIAELPAEHINALDIIRVNPASFVQGKNALATAVRHPNRQGVMDFYPSGMKSSNGYDPISTAWHEMGHLIASNLFGGNENQPLAIPSRLWDSAMRRDIGNNQNQGRAEAVSTYATTNIQEDFAEATMLYIATDGGRRPIPRAMAQRLGFERDGANIRAQFRERFMVLDRHFATHPSTLIQVREQVGQTLKKLGVIGGTLALGIAGGYVFSTTLSEDDEE